MFVPQRSRFNVLLSSAKKCLSDSTEIIAKTGSRVAPAASSVVARLSRPRMTAWVTQRSPGGSEFVYLFGGTKRQRIDLVRSLNFDVYGVITVRDIPAENYHFNVVADRSLFIDLRSDTSATAVFAVLIAHLGVQHVQLRYI